MRKLTLSLLAGAAVLAGGVAFAQQPQHAERQMTRTDAEQRAEQMFDRLDANHDGKLDQADRAERQKARFDRIDANHDGAISYAEFSAMHAQSDGARKERLADRGGARGEHFQRSGHRMGMMGRDRGYMARLADSDRDGAITKAEFQAAALARFDRLDANKDGTVSPDEAKAARDTMRRQWQARGEAQQAG